MSELKIRRANERGSFDHGWLKTHHSFSFADYYDPQWMGFKSLRVINEDFVAPGMGFGQHGHRDMEIITFVMSGAVEHKDSMGNGSIIRPGEIQYMSAGKGVLHSEFNPDPNEVLHLYQIWIMPNVMGAPPRYAQNKFDLERMSREPVLLASPDGEANSIAIRQNAWLWGARLASGTELKIQSRADDSGIWIQVTSGNYSFGEFIVNAGDAVYGSANTFKKSNCFCQKSGELLVFELR